MTLKKWKGNNMGEINNEEFMGLIRTYLVDSVVLPYGSYDTYHDYVFGDLDKFFSEIYVKNENILTNGLPDNWDNEFKD